MLPVEQIVNQSIQEAMTQLQTEFEVMLHEILEQTSRNIKPEKRAKVEQQIAAIRQGLEQK
jgi:hypothetical protein